MGVAGHAICVLYCHQPCCCPGNLPSLNDRGPGPRLLSKRIVRTADPLNFCRRKARHERRGDEGILQPKVRNQTGELKSARGGSSRGTSKTAPLVSSYLIPYTQH